MDRTILVANTSNMPVAAREASVYTGITIAEYYRDQGYHVALLADSTSRWGEALREVSSRLEEMPAEEGYPGLPGEPARRVLRARRARRCAAARDAPHAARSRSSARSRRPAATSRSRSRSTACASPGAFWALDTALARQRHFPAIDWRRSYTLYDLDALVRRRGRARLGRSSARGRSTLLAARGRAAGDRPARRRRHARRRRAGRAAHGPAAARGLPAAVGVRRRATPTARPTSSTGCCGRSTRRTRRWTARSGAASPPTTSPERRQLAAARPPEDRCAGSEARARGEALVARLTETPGGAYDRDPAHASSTGPSRTCRARCSWPSGWSRSGYGDVVDVVSPAGELRRGQVLELDREPRGRPGARGHARPGPPVDRSADPRARGADGGRPRPRGADPRRLGPADRRRPAAGARRLPRRQRRGRSTRSRATGRRSSSRPGSRPSTASTRSCAARSCRSSPASACRRPSSRPRSPRRRACVGDEDASQFVVVFAAMGITEREAGVLPALVRATRRRSSAPCSFLNLADDPPVERLLTPRIALTIAEHLGFELGLHVLVILTDITNYCEALREVASARDEIPGRRGYPGYMYTDLASLFERAGRIRGRHGSVTQLADPHDARRRHHAPDPRPDRLHHRGPDRALARAGPARDLAADRRPAVAQPPDERRHRRRQDARRPPRRRRPALRVLRARTRAATAGRDRRRGRPVGGRPAPAAVRRGVRARLRPPGRPPAHDRARRSTSRGRCSGTSHRRSWAGSTPRSSSVTGVSSSLYRGHPPSTDVPLVFRSFLALSLVRGSRGHAGDGWFVDASICVKGCLEHFRE